MDTTSRITGPGPVSIEEFERLPDEAARLELVRGHVVREPPADFEHGGIGVQIGSCLHTYVRRHGLGKVLQSPLRGGPPEPMPEQHQAMSARDALVP